MPKSTKSRRRVKDTKPAKPCDGFPLFAHASGRWAKKIRQRIQFFGRWGHKKGDRIIPVEDIPASAAAALDELNRQWPYVSQGRTPPPIEYGGRLHDPRLMQFILDHQTQSPERWRVVDAFILGVSSHVRLSSGVVRGIERSIFP